MGNRSLEFFPHWRTNKEFTLFLVVHGMPVLFVIFLDPLATTLAPHPSIAFPYTIFPLSYAHNDYFTLAKPLFQRSGRRRHLSKMVFSDFLFIEYLSANTIIKYGAFSRCGLLASVPICFKAFNHSLGALLV